MEKRMAAGGHAMALAADDSYLAQPASKTLRACRLYGESLERYGKSPFIYPIYGLGGLPEGFSRLCAIHGGTFILNKAVDEVLFNADGTVAGVRSGTPAPVSAASCAESYWKACRNTSECTKGSA